MDAKEKYIDFCATEDMLPIFFQPWFLDGVCPNSNWDAVVSEQDGKVVGIFPYYLKFKKPYNYISMPPNSRMMGPYVTYENRDEEAYRKIVKQLSKALPKVEFFYQSFHYAVTDWLTFYSQKYNGKKLYSFILHDFKDLKKTYSAFSRNLRDKQIPKAKSIVKISSGMEADAFYDLLSKNRKEENKKLDFKADAFKSHYQSLKNNNSGEIYYAHDKEGNIHSAGLLMWDKLSSYFYITAENPEFKFSHSLSYLTWHCIEVTANQLKLDYFDFGGNHIESIEKANHPYNAVQIPFLNISRYDSQKFTPFKTMKKRAKRKNK